MVQGPDEIMDVRGASAYLCIKERTLYNLLKQKKVPAIKVGGQWRFKKSRLDAMFDLAADE